MRSHVVLLRAVNVGGVRLPMALLREIVEAAGHTEVATYVQSGNLVLRAARRTSTADLAAGLRREIHEGAGVDTETLVLTARQWREVIENNPFPLETDGTRLHAFVRQDPVTADHRDVAERLRDEAREKGSDDDLAVVGRVIYLHLPNGLGRSELASRMTRLRSVGASLTTARNWRTVLALQALFEAPRGPAS